jgi:hypothetical protein
MTVPEASQRPSAEDIRKCGEEIKQLRNQQFVIATGAITVVAAFVTKFVDATPKLRTETVPFFGLTTLAVQVLLLGLFWWSLQLRALIGIISFWLERAAVSQWEAAIRAFDARHKRRSQTTLASALFALLGVVAAAPFPMATDLCQLEFDGWHVLSALFVLAYLAIVISGGMFRKRIDRRVKTQWIAVNPHFADAIVPKSIRGRAPHASTLGSPTK